MKQSKIKSFKWRCSCWVIFCHINLQIISVCVHKKMIWNIAQWNKNLKFLFLAFARYPPQLRNYCCWLIGGWKLVLCRQYRSLSDIFDESGSSPSTTCSYTTLRSNTTKCPYSKHYILLYNIVISLLQALQTLSKIWICPYTLKIFLWSSRGCVFLY